MTNKAALKPNPGQAVVYRIDAHDRLTDVNDAWVAFAASNGAGALRPADVSGRVLWDFLSDATTVHLYRTLCTRLRNGGPPVEFRFRCDAPDLRRLLEMEMTCTDGECIAFSVTPVAEQRRATLSFVGVSQSADGDRLISMCSWCKRVQLADLTWVEIEDSIEKLMLFQSASPPPVSHGICEGCEAALWETPKELLTLGTLPVS